MASLVENVIKFIASDPTVFDAQRRNDRYDVLQGKDQQGMSVQVWRENSDSPLFQIMIYHDDEVVYRQDIYPDIITDRFAETSMDESQALNLFQQYIDAVDEHTIDSHT